jgi:hypothetical protein
LNQDARRSALEQKGTGIVNGRFNSACGSLMSRSVINEKDSPAGRANSATCICPINSDMNVGSPNPL